MGIITEFLNWYLMLFVKIFLWGMIFAFAVWALLMLSCYLLVWGESYLKDIFYSITDRKQDNKDDNMTPPCVLPYSNDSADNLEEIKDDAEKDDYGINMEGMNGYPGGYGDEQMFEDEEEFLGMDYGLLDDEAKGESNESGDF